jgi:uncharacterized membrane protein YhaH (DUF805 family)
MGTFDDLLGRRSGRIGPAGFFGIGLSLFALKFALDRTVATIGFGRGWSVLNYLIPNEAYALPALPRGERMFYLTMAAVALPFVWIGIVVTLRRLHDARLPRWLVGLFFIPAVNLLFFAALSVVPSAKLKRDDDQENREPLGVLPATNQDVGALPYGVDDALPGNRVFNAVMPRSNLGSAMLATFATATLGVGVTLLSANVMRDYGWGLFIGMPFFVGMTSAVLYGYRTPRTIGQCILVALGACVVAAAMMIAVAIEGAGCLIMLMPLALPIAAMGAACGYAIQARPQRSYGEINTLWATTLTLPAMIIAEARLPRDPPSVFAVTTIVEVAAPPEKVWPNVIEFGQITTPPEMIFRAGVAYPLRARIDGRGVGAVRYCEFSTGAFVEPIETWNEPRLLKFAVTRNPPPMHEWSPWKVRPPHLDNFLVSHGGQFELTPLPGGRTRLAGTTWYEHRMWPQRYWRWWSDFLIHRIHSRVLEHVKALSE